MRPIVRPTQYVSTTPTDDIAAAAAAGPMRRLAEW